jgi:hypothetical protein
LRDPIATLDAAIAGLAIATVIALAIERRSTSRAFRSTTSAAT